MRPVDETTCPDSSGFRDLTAFLGSHAGHEPFTGSWAWFLVIVVMVTFNTVLGEEPLFRGSLLPRMADTCGRAGLVSAGGA